jgi:hypothetical protein
VIWRGGSYFQKRILEEVNQSTTPTILNRVNGHSNNSDEHSNVYIFFKAVISKGDFSNDATAAHGLLKKFEEVKSSTDYKEHSK